MPDEHERDDEELEEEEEEEEGGDEKESSTITSLRKQLRDAQKESKSLKDDAELGRQTKRERAFSEAGIDLSTTLGKLFAKSYDGELTAEAIKAAAESDGIEFPSGDGEGEGEGSGSSSPTPEEREQSERAQQATAGAPPAANVNTAARPFEVYQEERAAGSTREKAMAAAVVERMKEEPEKK